MHYVINKARSDQKGFSLIELLIVVVIIGVIAAIAIPNLLSARRSANEGSAVSAMRTLHGAQMTYASTVGNGNYAGGTSFSILALRELGTPGARIIDDSLDTGTKSGYACSVRIFGFTDHDHRCTPDRNSPLWCFDRWSHQV
jgi:prepilin-type N-terminal cleavage/methylation domain-containing protein